MKNKMMAVLTVLLMCLPALMAVDVYAEPGTADHDGGLSDIGEGEYVEGTVLVKDADFDRKDLNVPYRDVSPMYPGGDWYVVELKDGTDTLDALKKVRDSGRFDDACLNMTYRTESVDVSGNPEVGRSTYLDSMGIREAWDALAEKGVSPGGSRDVVLAVLDTGVDYTHPDLAANIWVNEDEIPGNGIDDDGNGYVDDVHGWDFFNKDDDPMDDHGHGTHVAGIAAAVNNDLGTVGVAFNCRIMCLKAADETGHFSDVSVARALHYAADNGAHVINMSFGGGRSSAAEYDALMDIQDRCITVAAAGNSSLCNDVSHMGIHETGRNFPGAFPCNISVMSTEKDGRNVSWFSNYDHVPYDSIEYDVYSAGSDIYSTYPNGFTTLSGTSMATPVVTGIVALLLSSNPDREVLTLDMVRSAVVNSGSISPYNAILKEHDTDHRFCDAADALRILEEGGKPFVNPGDVHTADAETGKELNMFDVPKAGQDLIIGADLFNRGADAGDVKLRLVSHDEYLTAEDAVWEHGDIACYRGVPCVMSGESPVNVFRASISPDCPDSRVIEYALVAEYTDPVSGASVTTEKLCRMTVERTKVLPAEITEDTVFDRGHRYVLEGEVVIPSGVTVTFSEGCRIGTEDDSCLKVNGTLILNGTPEDRIKVSTRSESELLTLECADAGSMGFVCADLTNTDVSVLGDNPQDRVSYDRCILSQYARSSTSVDLVNFNGSMYEGSSDIVRVNGASGSCICFSKSLLCADIVGLPVKDTVFMFDLGEYTYSEVRISAAVSNSVFACSAECSLESAEFDTEGAVFSDVFADPVYGQFGITSCGFSELDASVLWPMMIGCEFIGPDGEAVGELSNDAYTMRLQFSRPMDPDTPIDIIRVQDGERKSTPVKDGRFVSASVWECPLDLKKLKEDGDMSFRISGGADAALPERCLVASMGNPVTKVRLSEEPSVFAEPREQGFGVEVFFTYPPYLDCAGYNLYRTDADTGETQRVNDAMIPAIFVSYEDTEAQQGRTYSYSLAWVDMELRESELRGSAEITVPGIMHDVPSRVFSDTDVVLTFGVCGDIDPVNVSVRYETQDGWAFAQLEGADGRYVFVIPCSALDGDELCYYISVSDGTHTMTLGDGHHPLTVTVEDRHYLAVAVFSAAMAALCLLMMAVFRRR